MPVHSHAGTLPALGRSSWRTPQSPRRDAPDTSVPRTRARSGVALPTLRRSLCYLFPVHPAKMLYGHIRRNAFEFAQPSLCHLFVQRTRRRDVVFIISHRTLVSEDVTPALTQHLHAIYPHYCATSSRSCRRCQSEYSSFPSVCAQLRIPRNAFRLMVGSWSSASKAAARKPANLVLFRTARWSAPIMRRRSAPIA